ncbi:hypothetical protein BC629DRAFT_1515791, partial [Irpex lacteus]
MPEEKTHEPVPLRAYDVDGNLIAPGDCRMKKLQGADVLVKFTVMHQWFGRAAAPDTKKDNYYADIDEIRVLKAPQLTPTSPRKRVRENTAQDSDGLSHKRKRTRTKNC